ncbi:MAG: Lrp/AsnC family transcriptional regulator [Candidatus Bathyarchaeota archaeon]|jgi:DNA-binding Lrp family transcriptional regulator
MRELKPIDKRILSELMKNARLSDRKLAKILGVSQATVSRRRAFLEKEFIDGYTAIPKWDKLGYEILSIILVKAPLKFASEEERNNAFNASMEWLSKQHNVIMGSECRGMGMTGMMISLHKSYAEFDEFMNNHRKQLGSILEDVQTIVVNLSGKAVYRPLGLEYLAQAET